MPRRNPSAPPVFKPQLPAPVVGMDGWPKVKKGVPQPVKPQSLLDAPVGSIFAFTPMPAKEVDAAWNTLIVRGGGYAFSPASFNGGQGHTLAKMVNAIKTEPGVTLYLLHKGDGSVPSAAVIKGIVTAAYPVLGGPGSGAAAAEATPKASPLTRDDVIAAITHAARDVVHAGGSDAAVATLDAALKAADAEGYGHSARALAAAIVEELEDAPAAPATVASTPGKANFYTLAFFWGKVVPGAAKQAKEAGGLIQVYFTKYGWESRDDKSQPRTKGLFALVDASGNVTEGPAFDPAFRELALK